MNDWPKKALLISLLVKFVIAFFIPLTLDEYYYFLWGQFPSLSYFDHPPMTGWLMVLAQPFRHLGEGAIRLPFILISHCTILVWLKILKDEVSTERLKLFLGAALLNPLWGLGVFVATPDIPLLFFWSLALYYCKNILTRDRWTDSLGLGLALGFGFLSKYQVALFLPCLLLMLWQQKAFSKLLRLKTLLAIVVALIACSPVFIWNVQHDWASINFQWKHGMSSRYWHWKLPFEYALTQTLILFPTFLLFLINQKKKYLKHWLFPFVIFPFAFFLYSSFKARVEGNWVIMAFPCVYALAVLYSNENQIHWCKKTIKLWATAFVLALGLVAFEKHLPENRIKLFETRKFEPLLEKIEPQKRYFTFNYQLAAYLSFKKERLVCKLKGFGRDDHFQFIPSCLDLGDEFQYITESHDKRNFQERLEGYMDLPSQPLIEGYKLVEIKKK